MGSVTSQGDLRLDIDLPPKSNGSLFASSVAFLQQDRFSLSFFSLAGTLYRVCNKFFFIQRDKLNINVG